MSYDHRPDYKELLAHTSRHQIKEWLIRGAEREDAQTILAAIKRQSAHRLARKVAAMLVVKEEG